MVVVILVEPKYDGNIGAVARVMKNFGFSSLRLVNPCVIAKEGYQRAMHAQDILEKAMRQKFDNFEIATKDIDYLVGTTGISNISEKKHLRVAITPKELQEKICNLRASTVGIAFGREDFGLFNDELKKCDILVTVPCENTYPIMNISHAAAVILYEISQSMLKPSKPTKATEFEKDKFLDKFSEFLDSISYPEHKKENTEIMVRRIIGRATLSKWEFYTLMGVLTKVHRAIKTQSR